MNSRRTAAVVGCALALSLALRTSGLSQNAAPPAAPRSTSDSALEARTSAVAAQLRCPVCQGLSIQDSPAELAQQMRSLVRQQLSEGKSPDQVKAYFVSKYGEWILLAPKPSGFNLIAYGLPVLAVIGGAITIVLAVRRWTSGSGEGHPTDGAETVAQGRDPHD